MKIVTGIGKINIDLLSVMLGVATATLLSHPKVLEATLKVLASMVNEEPETAEKDAAKENKGG